MASSASDFFIILNEPSDWHVRLCLVKRKARNGGVAKYVDLTATEQPPAPIEPDIPMPKDIKEGANDIFQLSHDEREWFKFLLDMYMRWTW
jgi:hypothetical protein